MSMFSQFPLCRLFAALVFLGVFALAVQAQPRVAADIPVAQPVADKTEALPDKDEKDEVILSLVHSLGVLRGMQRSGHPEVGYFAPRLIVWKDGRVLFGHFNPTPERRFLNYAENWTYSWGKIDPEKGEELARKLRTAFGFGRNGGTIIDDGPGSSPDTLYWVLDGKTYKVTTWEMFNNVDSVMTANRPVFRMVDRVGGGYRLAVRAPLTLRRFYDIWRQTKSDVITWGEAAVKEDSIPVQVVVDGAKMTVKDKEGKILVHVPSLNRW